MKNYEIRYLAAEKALKNYRQAILEEFLQVAKELSKELETLCETGVDHERHICFEEHEEECADWYQTIKNRALVIDVKEVLDSMQDEDAFELYKGITAESVAVVTSFFAQMLELEELSDKYLHVEYAIKEL